MPLAQADAGFIEKRQSPRHRVQCPAWVDCGVGSQLRSCTVWDMSDAGARISIDAPAEVPGEFSLVFTIDGSVRRRCQVVWRSDGQLGARYLPAHS